MSWMIRASFAFLLTAVSASPCAADLISWGSVQEVQGPSDVSQNGFAFAARNLELGGVSNPTINGVTFTSYAPPGWTSGATGLLDNSSTTNSQYDLLLDSSCRTGAISTSNPTGWGGIRIDNLVPFTIGSVYEVQVWFTDQRIGTDPLEPVRDREMRLRSATGAATQTSGSVTNLPLLGVGTRSDGMEADPNNTTSPGDAALGSYVIGTFRRTTTSQLWILVQAIQPGTPSDLRPEICAFQIRQYGSTGAFDFCGGDGTANDGAGIVYCPCANNSPPGLGRGCINSSGLGARMTASGTNLVALDNLQFSIASAPAFQPAMLIQGRTRIAITFKDGVFCLGNPTERMEVLFMDVSGQATSTGSVVTKGGVQPGDTLYYQIWYRNPGGVSPCGTGSNFTQGMTVVWM